jgi:hypothetical protein
MLNQERLIPNMVAIARVLTYQLVQSSSTVVGV